VNNPENSMAEPTFFHATITNLDNQPLYTRGEIPTIHSSLTYAAWYGYWLANMAGRGRQFFVYRLRGVLRYLIPTEEGMYYVRAVGSFPEDDRAQTILVQAPDLFHKGWKWSGGLSYIPAHCLEQVSLPEIREKINPDMWADLSQEVNDKLRPGWLRESWWGGRAGKMDFPTNVPDFLLKD